MEKIAARYVLRFDDICPTMNWRIWADIESILDLKNIKPIMAVVPDNRDSKLMVDPPSVDFWNRVRNWQSRGWSIGLHGYQHVYVNGNAGILLHPNRRSEFAGLTREEQAEKLSKGLKIFQREGVVADCWVAPAHTFDSTTVYLLNKFDLKVISDGFWPWPHTDKDGMVWVPHQLSFLEHKRAGIWGVGHHINSWNKDQVNLFREAIDIYTSSITSLSETLSVFRGRKLSVYDILKSKSFWATHCWIKPTIRNWLL